MSLRPTHRFRSVSEISFAVFSLACVSGLAAAPASAQVTVKLYNTAVDTGTGVSFADLASTFQSPTVSFLTDNNQQWFPLGFKEFGADITGTITAPAAGNYTFTLTSDDGSYMFANGSSVPFINDGTNHPPSSASASVLLAAGQQLPFEIQFHENGTGSSGVDLSVTPPGGVSELVPASYFASPAAVPEASTTVSFGLLLMLGLGGLVITAKCRKGAAQA